ncbi:sigma-70 family RNA polymerase sigma factor [candidate division GN15 bacterium]|nr:sigma-70 family RNA polymerase sigma factor [candidate division GN15 bacterium]
MTETRTPSEITRLLEAAGAGDQVAINDLLPLIYDEVKRLAQAQLRSERADHTLNATALVHEAYLKLVVQDRVSWQNRAHFFAIAAQAMRRILVDYARGRIAQKRGGGQPVVTLNEEIVSTGSRAEDIAALDEALERLGQLSERQCKIVELRFFSGLTEREVAEAVGVSEATVKRDWRMARAWLSKELKDFRL